MVCRRSSFRAQTHRHSRAKLSFSATSDYVAKWSYFGTLYIALVEDSIGDCARDEFVAQFVQVVMPILALHEMR